MNAMLDLIVPPIIAGLLIIMLFISNMGMTKSMNENRLTFSLQDRANTGLLVVQEKVRGMSDLLEISDDSSSIKFETIKNNIVRMYQDDRKLMVQTTAPDGSTVTEEYALRLGDIDFTFIPAYFLNVEIITESTPDKEVGSRDVRFKGVAEQKIFLRNFQTF